MHRSQGCGVVLFLLLLTGCGGSSDSTATPETTGQGEDVRPHGASSHVVRPHIVRPRSEDSRLESSRVAASEGVPRNVSADGSADVSAARPAAPKIMATSGFPTRDGGQPVAYKYRVHLDSRCLARQPDDTSTRVDADSTFTYSWQWRGSEAALRLDSLKVCTTIDGQRVMDSSMSGNHFYLSQGDHLMSEKFENADPQLKQVLRECFRGPLCRMVVDEQGRELERTITAGPAAQSVVNTGIVTNTRLFHGPFPGGREKWESPGEMATGDGGHARGEMAYETTGKLITEGDEPSMLVEVKVSGTLTGEAVQPGSPVTNAVYQLDGTQIYNRRLKEWISGVLTVGVSFDMHSDGQDVANSGTIRLAMELVDSQPLPPVRVAEQPATQPVEPALR